MKIINVVGARPNFIKMAPLLEEFKRSERIESVLVHTGQHYDRNMSDVFFHQLNIPKPDYYLAVGSASHAVQTAEIMKAFEPVVLENKPDAVVVVGDVNSTIACGLVAVKLGVKLIHVEAGLRSYDRSMPEEVNRVLTDSISDILFCTEQSAVDNLIHEGVSRERVFLVGNVMIDSLLKNMDKAEDSHILHQLDLTPGKFSVLTLHRPATVDDAVTFSRILDAVEVVHADSPLIFPVHPRTQSRLLCSPLGQRIRRLPFCRVIDPLGHFDFLKLIASAQVVLTDSGGIQAETTFLRIPCLTLRPSTEQPVTVQMGSNRITGTEPHTIIEMYKAAKNGGFKGAEIPPLWDGHAAQRITETLLNTL